MQRRDTPVQGCDPLIPGASALLLPIGVTREEGRPVRVTALRLLDPRPLQDQLRLDTSNTSSLRATCRAVWPIKSAAVAAVLRTAGPAAESTVSCTQRRRRRQRVPGSCPGCIKLIFSSSTYLISDIGVRSVISTVITVMKPTQEDCRLRRIFSPEASQVRRRRRERLGCGRAGPVRPSMPADSSQVPA